MRVIITGGTGLIGSALARNLAEDGHEAIVLSRNPQKYAGELPPSIRLERWDARSAEGWGHLADGAEAIVNLAGESIAGESILEVATKRWNASQKKRIRDSRLNAGKAVTEAIAAAEKKPKVLIQGSAVDYYSIQGDQRITEESPAGSNFLANTCMEWEASTQAVEAMGLRRAILRTAGVVMSLEGGALPFILLPFKLFIGGPLGSGKQYFSWIHLADEVRAIRFLIDHPEAWGPFNICSPETVTNAELSKTIGRVMGRPSFFPTPAFALRLAFGEKADVLLASHRQVPEKLQKLGFAFQYPKLEQALHDLWK